MKKLMLSGVAYGMFLSSVIASVLSAGPAFAAPVLAGKAATVVGAGLDALGAVADIDQLFNKPSDEEGAGVPSGSGGSFIGGIAWDQEVTIREGTFEGAAMTLNQLLVMGSNIALILGDQVLEFRNTDVFDSDVVSNIVVIDDSNIGLLDIEQIAEYVNSSFENNSSVQVNTVNIESSTIIGAVLNQKFEVDGAQFDNTQLNANVISTR